MVVLGGCDWCAGCVERWLGTEALGLIRDVLEAWTGVLDA